MAEVMKGLKLLFCSIGICLVTIDNSLSPGAIESLNISSIANLTQTVNSSSATLRFNFTTIVPSSAFFAVLESTTATSELQNTLSIVGPFINTSSTLESSSASVLLSITIPKGVESLVVKIHPTSTASAKVTDVLIHGLPPASISFVNLHSSSSVILDHSTSNHSELTLKYLTLTSTHSNLDETHSLETGTPSGHQVSTNISFSAMRNSSELTRTHLEPGFRTANLQARPQNSSHEVTLSPHVSTLPSENSSRYSEPAKNISNSESAVPSSNSSSISKLNASFPMQEDSAEGVNVTPETNFSNGELLSALTSVFGVARLNSSALHLDHSTLRPYMTPASNHLNTHSAAVQNVSGTARLNSSILELYSSTAVPNSDAPEIIHQGLDYTNQTKNSTTTVDLIWETCRGIASSNGSTLCNLTSDPTIYFEDLKLVTAMFNYSDYFEDLNDLAISPDEPEIPDIDYYEMNPITIMSSRTFEWYSSWTAIRQGTPNWTKNGEWKLFYTEFFGDSNFGCPVDIPDCSLSVPKIDEIRQMFPDNRPLGRRVLFVAHTFKMMHDLANRVNERFTTVEVHFRTLVKDLVETFTLQVDIDVEAKCKTIHTIVQESVNLVVNTALSVLTDGVGGGTANFIFNKLDKSLTDEGSKMAKKVEWGIEVYKATRATLVSAWLHGPQNTDNFLKWSQKEFPEATAEDVAWRNAFVNDAYRAWPSNQLKQSYEHPDAGLRGGGVPLPKIVGGKTDDSLCSAFGGDWKDLNPKNYDLVAERVSAELANGRVQVQNLFKAMTRGAAPEVGAPSMVARWMLARIWVGKEIPGTVEYDLDNAVHFNSHFEIAFAKELASSTLAAGYNYMKCSHVKDSAERCGKTGDRYESIICPRPKTDPDLVCQTGRWYFGTYPHETVMDAIRKVEGFGHLHGLQFSRRDMLQEIYDNYEKHGNKPYEPAWGFDSLNSLEPPRGFHLPVCMRDGQSLTEWDFQRPWQHNWDFPAICGNHAANETAEVMMGLGLGPESPRHDDATFTNRVPHLLSDRGERPFTVYMTFCELGMRWPNKDEDQEIRTDKDLLRGCGRRGHPDCPDVPYGDRDCGLVRTATSRMTSDEANLWFCTNAGDHTIFERQREWVRVHQIPYEDWALDGGWFAYGFWWRNAKYHCDKWLTRGEGQIDQALEVITNQTLGG